MVYGPWNNKRWKTSFSTPTLSSATFSHSVGSSSSLNTIPRLLIPYRSLQFRLVGVIIWFFLRLWKISICNVSVTPTAIQQPSPILELKPSGSQSPTMYVLQYIAPVHHTPPFPWKPKAVMLYRSLITGRRPWRLTRGNLSKLCILLYMNITIIVY